MRNNLLLLGLIMSFGLSNTSLIAKIPSSVKKGGGPGAVKKSNNARLSKKNKALSRSFPSAPGGNSAQPTASIVFDKTVYAQPQPGQSAYLYLGLANILTPTSYTLSRGVISDGGTLIQPMLTPPFNLNGASVADIKTVNFIGRIVNNLMLLQGLSPVMTVTGWTQKDPINQIWVFNTTASPLSFVTNDTEIINDAAGNPIDHPIQAITTAVTPAGAPTSSYILAAVSQAGSEFKTDTSGTGSGSIYRGIAVAKVGTNKIDILNYNNFSLVDTNDQAAPLSLLPADDVVAFVDPNTDNPTIVTAELASNDVAMWYDNDYLQRLYIGLSGVKRDDSTKEGGVLSLALGYIDQNDAGNDNNLVIQAVVADPNEEAPTKAQFYDPTAMNNTNGIIGFYADGLAANNGNRDIANSTRHIRTMHTTTGYDYVIVHTIMRSTAGSAGGLVIGDNIIDQVYALAVAPYDPDNPDDSFIGQIVKVENHPVGTPSGYNRITKVYTPVAPQAYVDMPHATDTAAMVGAGGTAGALVPTLGLQVVDGTYIEDMVVSGDAVYIALAGPNNHNAGIYQSKALFNTYGFIRAWTPWQRVMGDMRRVKGMGVSNLDGSYAFLTTQYRTDLTRTNTFDTVRATAWGTTDSVTAQDAAVEGIAADNLSSLLATLFPQTAGGVLGLYSFDEYTPGFMLGRFAMMVALGTSSVALIQTGQFVNGEFAPVTTFSTTGPNQNVFVINSDVLKAIAPLTCAEVSRIADGGNDGWLFVGGYGGVAVLSLANGTGFTSNQPPAPGVVAGGGLSSLSSTGFPGLAGWSFKQLNPSVVGDSFSRTRKLAAAHGYLYVMTFNATYRFAMVANKFMPPVAPLTQQTVATPVNVKLNDMVLVQGTDVGGANDRILLATTQGIVLTGPAQVPAFVNVANIGLTSPDVARLAYLGQDRQTTTAQGNLYALVQNLLDDDDATYRFDVNANGGNPLVVGNVMGIQESDRDYYIDFDQARSGIFPDGPFLYSTRSADFGQTIFLELHKVSDVEANTVTNDLTSNLGVDTTTNVLVDGLIREGASGALMLPADWGVRVNQ